MVRMGSPVRFRRGAPPQTSRPGRVRARPVVRREGRQLPFARNLPVRFVRCESVRAACVVWFWEGERYRAVSGFFACPMPEHLGVWGGYELGVATLKRPPPAKPAGGRQARPRPLG